MSEPCEYVIAFKPLWTTLSLYAAWPLRITKGGQLVRSVFSLRWAVTCVALSLSCWRSWVVLDYHVRLHSSVPSSNVPLRVLNIQYAVYVLSVGIHALFVLGTGRSVRYARRWQQFQPQLERVCGRSMRNDKLRRSLKYTALALSVGWPTAVIVPFVCLGEESHITLAEILYQSYATTVFTLASTNWRMHCAFLRLASVMLVDTVDQAMQREDGTLSPEEVVRLSRTWAELRDLVQEGARFLAPTTVLTIIIMSATVLLCVFNTMHNMLNGYSSLGLILSGLGVISGSTLFRIFNAGHRVGLELSDEALLALARSRRSDRSADVELEINHFRMMVVACPVSMNLLGLLDVNRGVLRVLLAAMATYLVVLVQVAVG